MKLCFFLIAAALVSAQAPPPTSPETVVVKIDGKEVTAGEIQHMLQAYPPAFMQTFQRDPREALKQIFMVRYTASEGEKLKLGDMDPWKEQIEVSRMNVVSAAMFNYTRNTYQVTEDDIDAFYKRNLARYEEATVKVIKIGFKPGLAPNLSVEEIAKRALESEHAGNERPEAQARTLATGLVKQLRDGADFAQMVKLYSDDADSKAADGDFGTVRPNSPYAEEFKKAVFALKPGDISDPIQTGPAFYIVKVVSKTAQPISKVHDAIREDIKDLAFRDYLMKLQERFTPELLRPDVLVQMNAAFSTRK